MNRTAKVLYDAADLVEVGWCWGTYARDQHGQRVRPRHPHSVCWCAVGAMEASSPDEDQLSAALGVLSRFLDARLVGLWNDAQDSPEPVAAALRTAAKGVEG